MPGGSGGSGGGSAPPESTNPQAAPGTGSARAGANDGASGVIARMPLDASVAASSAIADGPDCGAPPPFSVKPGKGPLLIGVPAWAKASTDPVVIAWRVSAEKIVINKTPRPMPMNEAGSHVERRVELTIRQGSVSHVVLIPAVGEGWFTRANQSFCMNKSPGHAVQADAHGQLSEVTFTLGGVNGYAVRMPDPGVLQVVSVSGGDGACAANSYQRVEVARVNIPLDVTLAEELHVAQVDGGVEPDPCTEQH